MSTIPSVRPDDSETELDQASNDELDAAIYVRTSSSSQRFGYSIDEQIRRCWERCDSAGWTVKYVFSDEAESGRNTERPQFQQMLQRAEEKVIDVVVFWKLDRFCRSLTDLVNVEERLNEWGVALHSVTEHIDTTSPVGRFNFRNLASAAELESDLTSQRAKMGMYGLAQTHRWPNEKPPLGYKLQSDDTLEVIAPEAELVYRIFQSYLDKRSMPEVAFRLNERDITTKSGDSWNRQAVRVVLTNEIYIGKYKVAEFEEDVSEYRIIPDQLFADVTQVRYRFQNSKPRMKRDRKEKKAERVLKAYQGSEEMNDNF